MRDSLPHPDTATPSEKLTNPTLFDRNMLAQSGEARPSCEKKNGRRRREKAMSIVIICILVAATLPYAFLAVSAWPSQTEQARWGIGYDHGAPRDSAAHLQGFRKRAYAAQLNGYEAFPPFAAAILCAHLTGVSDSQLTVLGVAFLALRVLHGVLYIMDRSILRSVVWFLATAVVVTLFVLALSRA